MRSSGHSKVHRGYDSSDAKNTDTASTMNSRISSGLAPCPAPARRRNRNQPSTITSASTGTASGHWNENHCTPLISAENVGHVKACRMCGPVQPSTLISEVEPSAGSR